MRWRSREERGDQQPPGRPLRERQRPSCRSTYSSILGRPLVAAGLVAAVLWGLAKERGRCLGKGVFSRSCLFTGPGGTRSCGSRPVGPAGRKERRSGARGPGGNIPLRGYIKPHIVRGLDDWGGDRGFYNP